MTKSNEEIFLEFWANYQWPESKPVFYRLYHDDLGRPIVYSMEELPHKYIEISAQEYGKYDYQVRVKNGKLVPHQHRTVEKLVPGHGTGTACHPSDVTIVVTPDQPHQSWTLSNDQEN